MSAGALPRKWILRLLLASVPLAALGLAAVALELGLRLLDRPRWDRDIMVGWRFLDDKATYTNQLGFRGQPIVYSPTNRVVLLLGDSQVEAWKSPPDLMPEKALERHLQAFDPRYRVFSLGASGYGTDSELSILQEYFRQYRADLVLVWFTPANDFWNNLFPTHWPKNGFLKPTYRLVDGQLVGPNYRLDEVAQAAARTKLGVLWNRATNPRRHTDESWEKYLPSPYAALTQYDGPFSLDWDPHGPKGNVDESLKDENLTTEKAHSAIFLTPASPRMRYGIQLTRALLGSIESLCHDHNCQFAVFYRTVAESVEPHPPGIVVQKVGDKFYRSSYEQSLTNIAAALQSLPCLKATVTLPNWRCSESDGHLNSEAIDQAMSQLADQVKALSSKPGR